MIEVLVIIATAAILLFYYSIRSNGYWSRLGVKQGKPWIIFGDSWETFLQRSSFNDFILNLYNRHPDARYEGVYSFFKPVLLLRDPELIKQIGVKYFEHFTDHVYFTDPDADRLWSNGLFALTGERWKQMRQTLTPTFTSSKIKNMYSLILETAETFVKHFSEKDDKVISIEMKDAFSRFSNDVIATSAFGLKVDSLKEQKNIFYEMGKKYTDFGGFFATMRVLAHQVFPKISKYLGVAFLDKQASKYFYGVIDDTIKAREENDIVRQDLINLLLEARKNKLQGDGSNATEKANNGIELTNEIIASQAMVFFFAGFDTVSTAMSFASYELAINKDVQDLLRKEIIETRNDEKLTYDKLTAIKYMDMVVSEVLRKWPAVPNFERVCTKPFTIEPINKSEQPLKICKKQEVWIPTIGLHRDPKYFPNPEKFDPERFSDENKSSIMPYTYLPFGIGPRLCIGNRFALVEIKALLFNLLLNFEIVATEKTPIPLILAKDFSQVPEGGFWLGLKRIKV